MKKQTLNRRDFLRYSALGAGGMVLVACAPAVAPAPAAPTEAAGATAAPAASETVLDVVMDTPEYQNQHQQILDLFSDVHPGARVNLITHSEDGQPAYVAKVAGGYVPAME